MGRHAPDEKIADEVTEKLFVGNYKKIVHFLARIYVKNFDEKAKQYVIQVTEINDAALEVHQNNMGESVLCHTRKQKQQL